MKLYFITEKVTREAMMTVKEAPGRAKGVVTFAASFDVRIIEFFYCNNLFDFVMKVEAPDEESVTAFVMALNKSGNVTAQMTRAYTPDEWAGLVERLPA
ncbi:GYD domain-containing protein [Devosia algicola]|uniref:GYD domain-containing protein n=1 Tax=Devosia algicola TaxID=3026418 RepID=A0ABY7YRJ6_9HYPH|nr:GYD domain-containing protein [Devosia algicola]WDR03886.1 GYD domain-containing protein [Devosia algicola]